MGDRTFLPIENCLSITPEQAARLGLPSRVYRAETAARPFWREAPGAGMTADELRAVLERELEAAGLRLVAIDAGIGAGSPGSKPNSLVVSQIVVRIWRQISPAAFGIGVRSIRPVSSPSGCIPWGRRLFSR
jgi:hypothetical protein